MVSMLPIHIFNFIFVLLSGYGFYLNHYVMPNIGAPWLVPWYYDPLCYIGVLFPLAIFLAAFFVFADLCYFVRVVKK